VEFGNKLKSWSKFRRCIFTHLKRDENGQYVIGFAKPDSVIYTNIGMCKQADDRLKAAGGNHYFEAKTIMQKSHKRGADELIHRSIKELATKEQLPFKSFGMNRAYYFLLVITHFIFEAYKQDVTVDVIPITVYPNTFRRILIDFAAKITSRARSIVLNVTQTVFETINIIELWKRCLGAIYPPEAMGGPGVIEGDSPSLLYLVSANRGINDPEDPTQPSWGGQYIRVDSTNHYIDGPGKSTISKWSDDFQAEFKERADWMLP